VTLSQITADSYGQASRNSDKVTDVRPEINKQIRKVEQIPSFSSKFVKLDKKQRFPVVDPPKLRMVLKKFLRYKTQEKKVCKDIVSSPTPRRCVEHPLWICSFRRKKVEQASSKSQV
jgi:hypothetical protein